ncbi:hypothetical protein RIF29_36759 [Crotalaria pallida]|uniref:AT-hook motif nuclear-localized protein n=1 Tax=Crotalaria pallida TaxID=3830 RepID=A0AAN9EBV0_CROPI
MEARDGGVISSTGITVAGSDAPAEYHAPHRTENPAPAGGSAVMPAMPAGQGGAPSLQPVKKKRGRPRKYAPEGSVSVPMALSPKPISSSAPPPPPPVIDFTAEKLGKVGPVSTVSKTRFEVENIGEWVASSVGANFTPHIITVNSGEDVTMKVISFSQQGPRTICILSANGAISSVTLRQPDSSGGTLTYEGRFEILSLSGSFMPSESDGTRSRSGGMSVSLVSPDGRVVGGGVVGLLVAASPVQVVVGSFLTGNQHDEQKSKKQKPETISTTAPTPAVPVSIADPVTVLSSKSSFRGDNWPAMHVVTDTRNNHADINVSIPGG